MNTIDVALIIATITLLTWIILNRMMWIPEIFQIMDRLPEFIFARTRIRMFVEKWELAEHTLAWFISESESDIDIRRRKMNIDTIITRELELDYVQILGETDTIKLALHEDEMLTNRIVRMLSDMEILEKQVNMKKFNPSKSIRTTYKKTLYSLGIR